ncbi:hypothetical protein NQZ68_007719 [Dissostichus eleginoides]|nr:hypothetical protein NQZ68_007719 [Dissostichus eleginoides]
MLFGDKHCQVSTVVFIKEQTENSIHVDRFERISVDTFELLLGLLGGGDGDPTGLKLAPWTLDEPLSTKQTDHSHSNNLNTGAEEQDKQFSVSGVLGQESGGVI